MSVFRNKHRGNRWRYDFWVAGERHQGYCVDPATGLAAKNIQQARECEALARRELKQAGKAARSITRASGYSLLQAVTQHIQNQVDSSAMHISNLKLYGQELCDHFGANTPIASIDQGAVDAYRLKAVRAKVRIWTGGPRKRAKMSPAERAKHSKAGDRERSRASTNHYLDCLRAAFAVAHRLRDPVTGQPIVPYPPEVKAFDVGHRQPRPMPDAEFFARLAVAQPWVADAMELVRYFGLRHSEALGATLRHIDHEHRVLRFRDQESKSGRDEAAPPIGGGWAVVLRLERQARARGVQHLVTYAGKHMADQLAGKKVPAGAWVRIKSIRRAWAATARKAGIERPHRLHDGRARYITAVATVSPGLAQEAARHADPATTQLYIAHARSEVARAVKAIPRPKKPAQRARGRAGGKAAAGGRKR